jgi:hypothetical protein
MWRLVTIAVFFALLLWHSPAVAISLITILVVAAILYRAAMARRPPLLRHPPPVWGHLRMEEALQSLRRLAQETPQTDCDELEAYRAMVLECTTDQQDVYRLYAMYLACLSASRRKRR